MIDHNIQSLADLHHFVTSSYQGDWSRWYFRGQAKVSHKLVPKAGRPDFLGLDDRRIFHVWKRHAVSYLPTIPQELSDWDLLAIAQHHGLATRLLDWTFNPLTAAYFAIEDLDEDGAVYAHYSESLAVNPNTYPDPHSVTGIARLMPSSIVPRILRQGGIFTLHGPPETMMDVALPAGDRLERLVIPASAKREIATQLSHYGVNRMSLFPDLDGLSRHINWSFVNLRHPVRPAASPL